MAKNLFSTIGVNKELLKSMNKKDLKRFLTYHRKSLGQIFHPDHAATKIKAQKNNRKLQEINEAFELLKDDENFDHHLKLATRPQKLKDEIRLLQSETHRLGETIEKTAESFFDYLQKAHARVIGKRSSKQTIFDTPYTLILHSPSQKLTRSPKKTKDLVFLKVDDKNITATNKTEGVITKERMYNHEEKMILGAINPNTDVIIKEFGGFTSFWKQLTYIPSHGQKDLLEARNSTKMTPHNEEAVALEVFAPWMYMLSPNLRTSWTILSITDPFGSPMISVEGTIANKKHLKEVDLQ